MLLAKPKSLITLEDAKNTLELAKSNNIKTTISYISGLDSLEDMSHEFKFLKNSLTNFPVINVYQIQTPEQAKIISKEGKEIEYYLKSRQEVEKIFKDTLYQ